MSQANVEIVRSIYAASDLLALRDKRAPDIEFDFSDLFLDRSMIRGQR